MTAPSDYTRLPDGLRCKCMKQWQDPDGSLWCCRAPPIETVSPNETTSEHRVGIDQTLPLADHDQIGRNVQGLQWEIQSAVVTIASHCTVIRDKHPTGEIADLAACISQDLMELSVALRSGAPAATTQTSKSEVTGTELERLLLSNQLVILGALYLSTENRLQALRLAQQIQDTRTMLDGWKDAPLARKDGGTDVRA